MTAHDHGGRKCTCGAQHDKSRITDAEIALRLGNIETLLRELLDRRRADVRATVKKAATHAERRRQEARESGLATPESLEWARRAIAARRR